jgi:hypothetical protein
MAVRLLALRTNCPLPPRFLALKSVRGWVDPRTLVRLEGLGKLKKSTSLGLNPETFWLSAQCLNQLCYHMPQVRHIQNNKFWCNKSIISIKVGEIRKAKDLSASLCIIDLSTKSLTRNTLKYSTHWQHYCKPDVKIWVPKDYKAVSRFRVLAITDRKHI